MTSPDDPPNPVPEGAGAAVYKGRLVDIASIRQARALVAKAARIGPGG